MSKLVGNGDCDTTVLPEIVRLSPNHGEAELPRTEKPETIYLPPIQQPISKLVERGPRTLAAPIKERPFYRLISDTIANNYSPNAKSLTVTALYSATRRDKTAEEKYLLAGGRMYASDSTVNQRQIVAESGHASLNSRDSESALIEAIIQAQAQAQAQASGRANRRRRSVDYREHDAETLACLQVEFVPWYKATIGLSRPPTPDAPSSTRYYQLAETAVTTSDVYVLHEEETSRILDRVGGETRKKVSILEAILKEITNEYKRAMQIAVMNYVLRDEDEQQRLGVRVVFDSTDRSAGRYQFPWHYRLLDSISRLRYTMCNFHPVMQAVHTHFEKNYMRTNFRLLDIQALQASMPMTIEEFSMAIERNTHKARCILEDKWLADCAKLVLDKRHLVEAWAHHDDPHERSKRMDRFFSTLAQLMSNHLRYLTEATLHDFISLFEQYVKGNAYTGEYDVRNELALPTRKHVIRMFIEPDVENSATKFSPAFPFLIYCLENAVETIVLSCASLDRLETKLFHNPNSPKQPARRSIKTVIRTLHLQEEIVVATKTRLVTILNLNQPGPERYRCAYDPYTSLLHREAATRLQQFIAVSGNTLDKYVFEIERLKLMRSEVASLPVLVPMRLILLDCAPVHDYLQQRASEFVQTLVDHIVQASRKWNRQICVHFDSIVSKITSPMESTSHLVELQRYVESLDRTDLGALEAQLSKAAQNVLFLLDYASFLSNEDVALNCATFNWPTRIAPIVQNAETKLARERDLALQRLTESVKQFTIRLNDLQRQVKELSNRSQLSEAEQYALEIVEIDRKLQDCREERKRIASEETLLDCSTRSDWPQLSEIQSSKEPFERLWNSAITFQKAHDRWINGPLINVSAEEVRSTVDELWKTVYRLIRFFSQTDSRNPLRLAVSLKAKLDKFKLNLPLIATLSTAGLKPRHWQSMTQIVGFDLTPRDNTKFADLLQLGLEKHLESLEAVSLTASREFTLEQALARMKQDWTGVQLNLLAHKRTRVHILVGIDEVQVLLDDHLLKTMTIKGSPHVRVHEEEIDAWLATLRRVKSTLDCWVRLQTSWTYLQRIFYNADIRKQIPSNGGHIFMQVDKHWRELTELAASESNAGALSLLSQPELLESFEKDLEQLEIVHRALKDYLEFKRLLFPRFFFLSNDELIEVLSQAGDPTRIQPHLTKCFEGIHRLQIAKDSAILGMCSKLGECVSFIVPIDPSLAKGFVEECLIAVEQAMRVNLRQLLNRAISVISSVDSVQRSNLPSLSLFPEQIAIVADHVRFTADTTSAIETGSLEALLSRQTSVLNELVAESHAEIPVTQRHLTQTLVLKQLHQRDLLLNLQKIGVASLHDFEWAVQLRYYYEQDRKELMIQMLTSQLDYGFEYLGNQDTLVVTPLTNRCWRSVVTAFDFNFGAAVEGPAGTGKTETSKELAHLLGSACFVFNCSEAFDHVAMAKLLKGVALTNTFCIFDEFNRIELHVLSVIAQQLQLLQRCIAQRVSQFVFEGTELNMTSSRCAIVITMNPQYACRAVLPDNLKALFRPVNMIVPDYVAIAQAILFAYGFKQAPRLAEKLVTAFRYFGYQLSAQPHYDFGMRAIRSVLNFVTYLRSQQTDGDENSVIHRALIDVNLPKLVSSDVALFERILTDLFPTCVGNGSSASNLTKKAEYESLAQQIRSVAKRRNLLMVDELVTKCLQLFELASVRHGVMLVGDPISGKSTVLRTLVSALQSRVQLSVVYPKALTLDALFGRNDPATGDWKDGVFSSLFRRQAQGNVASNSERFWTVFDGPIDPLWVESLNTLLDDNRKLCLTSGEVIPMSDRQTIFFETDQLNHASPATVSRCGMVYSSARGLGIDPLVQSWLLNCNISEDLVTAELRSQLRGVLDWLLPPVIRFVLRDCVMLEQFNEMLLTLNFLRLYSALLEELQLIGRPEEEEVLDGVAEQPEVAPETVMTAQKIQEERFNWLFASLFFSVVNAIGACVDSSSRSKFDIFFKTLCETNSSASNNATAAATATATATATDAAGIQAKPKEAKIPRALYLPKKGTVFDYVFLRKPLGAWYTWQSVVAKPEFTESYLREEVFVNTAETEKLLFFMSKFVQQMKPMVLIGAAGTSKTATINYLSRSLFSLGWIRHQETFTAFSSASHLHSSVFNKLEKRGRGVYGLSGGRRLLLFIDDLNLPDKEQFDARPPLELLRQILDSGFVFHTQQPDEEETCELRDLTLLSSMRPPSSGRSSLPPRLLHHLFVYGVPPASDEAIRGIFAPLMDYHFSHFDQTYARLSRLVVAASIEIYRKCDQAFRPTPTRSHYLFSVRDIAAVISGFMQLPTTSLTTDTTQNALKLTKLWVHEAYRVLHDRLVNESERQIFFDMVRSVTETQFREKFATLFADILKSGNKNVTSESMTGLVFWHFSSRSYDASLVETVSKRLQQYLDDYNSQSSSPIDLVIFTQMVQHLTRLTRVLMRPNGGCGGRGHSLSIGLGGSGRESVTVLAAFIVGFRMFRVEVSSKYSIVEWRDDLRRLLRQAGLDCVRTVFLIADHQIKDLEFLEDISSILNNADMSSLFPRDERMQIVDKMQQVAVQQGMQIEQTPVNLMSLFMQRVRENLHLVITLSPLSSRFRQHIRQFPALTTCCNIDWFTYDMWQVWSPEALEKVALKYLEDVEATNEMRNLCVQCCRHFQLSCSELAHEYYSTIRRRVWVTPTSYLSMLRTFRNLLGKKRDQVYSLNMRYSVGLEKLRVSEAQVETMRSELESLSPQLIKMSRETEELIAVIESEKQEIERAKHEIEQEEAAAVAKAQRSRDIRDECDRNLQVALPAMMEASNALDTLKPSDIAVVKTLQYPPTGVKLVMEAICILKGIKPIIRLDDKGRSVEDYWPAAKKLISDINFLSSLKEFDKDSVPPAAMKKIRERYINNPEFDLETIRASSSACEGLCLWVRALEVYDGVVKIVTPKQAILREAEQQLAELASYLQEKAAELATVTEQLEAKKLSLEVKEADKRSLESQITLCTVKIERAERMVLALSDEKARWSKKVEELSKLFDSVVGDVLLASAMVAYLGPFTPSYRQDCVRNWHSFMKSVGVCVSDNFSLLSTFGDPLLIRDWQLRSLPSDVYSIENAIIATVETRWPLMIDPQRQMNNWLKKLEAENNLSVIQHSDPNHIRLIRNCIELGLPCLLENAVEHFDPLLEPVFLKQVFNHGGVESIRIGGEIVPYSREFRLYITTRLQNPLYMPEWSTLLNLICVITTSTGLEDQLKSIAVTQERPELEEKKNALAFEHAASEKQLKELENRILEVLNSSQGDILNNEVAVEVLQSSKLLANEIQEKQRISALTEQEIDQARAAYEPLGVHGSLLFFTASAMSQVCPLYQFSLQWFVKLFTYCIETSDRVEEVSDRIAVIEQQLTDSFYQQVARALCEKDQLPFSLLLCVAIAKKRGEMSDAEWEFLLHGSNTAEQDANVPASIRGWMTGRAWADVCAASVKLQCFDGWMQHVQEEPDKWRAVSDSREPHLARLPEPYQTKLSAAQRVILVRCLRIDKAVKAVQDYISGLLGRQFLEPPTFNLLDAYDDSTSTTPVCLFLASGSDPITSIYQLAEELTQQETGEATKRWKESRFSRLSSNSMSLSLPHTGKQRLLSSASSATGRRNQLREVKVKTISLGQGQGPAAERAIEEAAESGTWVVLQNCHLAGSWLAELERLCVKLCNQAPHPDFRLWLTVAQSSTDRGDLLLPVTLLQDSVKVACQSPQDLKASLLRSYTSAPVCQNDFFDGPKKTTEFRRLLFSLAFFHAVVQERKKAGSLGWNELYEFTDADFRVSAQQLRSFIDYYDFVPLETLTHLVAECNYGGRISDLRDLRLLQTLVERFYNSSVLQPNRAFYTDNDYYILESGDYDAYVSYIASLPINTPLAILGLHDNATIVVEQNTAQSLFETTLLTLPRLTFDIETMTARGETEQLIDSILRKLPELASIEELEVRHPVRSDESLNVVLHQEVTSFHHLVNTIKSSLEELRRAITGQAVMSPELEELVDSLGLGKVPASWLACSYPNVKPLGAYLSDLADRLRFFNKWAVTGIPSVFWIPAFFYGQNFMIGVLQNYARRKYVAVDSLDFNFEILPPQENENLSDVTTRPSTSAEARPSTGAKISGLTIEGARWCHDTGKLDEALPQVLFEMMPVIWMKPVEQSLVDKKATYTCPVYKTSARGKTYLCDIRLPSKHEEAHWIERGVALIGQREF